MIFMRQSLKVHYDKPNLVNFSTFNEFEFVVLLFSEIFSNTTLLEELVTATDRDNSSNGIQFRLVSAQ